MMGGHASDDYHPGCHCDGCNDRTNKEGTGVTFIPKSQLKGMRERLEQYNKEIARWDRPVSGFNEASQLTLGNLCVSIDETIERFNSAIEALEAQAYE